MDMGDFFATPIKKGDWLYFTAAIQVRSNSMRSLTWEPAMTPAVMRVSLCLRQLARPPNSGCMPSLHLWLSFAGSGPAPSPEHLVHGVRR